MQVIDDENPVTFGNYPLNMSLSTWADETAFAADVAGSVNYINGGGNPNFSLAATATSVGAVITVTGTSPGAITLTTNGDLFTP